MHNNYKQSLCRSPGIQRLMMNYHCERLIIASAAGILVGMYIRSSLAPLPRGVPPCHQFIKGYDDTLLRMYAYCSACLYSEVITKTPSLISLSLLPTMVDFPKADYALGLAPLFDIRWGYLPVISDSSELSGIEPYCQFF
jgi:hypothetical protein